MIKEESKKLRKRAEARLGLVSMDFSGMSEDNILKTLQELHIHQFELEMQNEELRLSHFNLEESRQYFNDFYNYTPAGYLTINNEGFVIQANISAAKMLGIEINSLINSQFTSLILYEDQDIFYFCRNNFYEKTKKQSCVLRLKKKDEAPFHAKLDCFFIPHIDGETGQFQIIISDLTETIQAENALQKSEKKYRNIFYESQVAMFRTSITEGKLIEANDEYAKLAGWATIEECKANFHPKKAWVDQKSRERLKKLLTKNGSVRDYEAEILRGDGITIWVRFSATIYPENGYMEGSIEDITKRKEAYDQLKNLNTTLDVLLKKREEENQKIGENIFSNYELMIGPFLNKLKNTASNKNQQKLIDIIEINLKEIITPFTKNLSNPMMSLTSSEIQIATMIKQGFTNKEISQTLYCSKRTIDTHRENIRKKLNLTNKKVNLKTFLLNF